MGGYRGRRSSLRLMQFVCVDLACVEQDACKQRKGLVPRTVQQLTRGRPMPRYMFNSAPRTIFIFFESGPYYLLHFPLQTHPPHFTVPQRSASSHLVRSFQAVPPFTLWMSMQGRNLVASTRRARRQSSRRLLLHQDTDS